MADDPSARFRINRVAETTGIPEATLRAWERRYHVPKPSRTPSGYRLYSADDVAQVRKMRELCEAGIAPADAAQQIRAQPAAKPRPDARPRSAQTLDTGPSTTPDAQDVRLMEVVTPEHTNPAGVLSLSKAVDLMERAATVAAARAVRSPAIVVSCGSIDLLVPVASGQLVEAAARLVQSREGALAVDVVLSVENVQSGKRDHVARSTFALVPLELEHS